MEANSELDKFSFKNTCINPNYPAQKGKQAFGVGELKIPTFNFNLLFSSAIFFLEKLVSSTGFPILNEVEAISMVCP